MKLTREPSRQKMIDALQTLYDLADGYIEASADALEVDANAAPAPPFVYRVRKVAKAGLGVTDSGRSVTNE